jgi:hypothetical protein
VISNPGVCVKALRKRTLERIDYNEVIQMMQRKPVLLVVIIMLAFAYSVGQTGKPAPNEKPGMLSPQDVKRLAPSTYFFRGQSAPVQLRNVVGLRTEGGKLVLAGLVDTSGYAADIKDKYQGFLITEVKLKVEDSELSPGQYGFGFKDGKFLVLDVGANDIASVSSKKDGTMAHPVPLKLEQDGESYKLYAGREWVTVTPE